MLYSGDRLSGVRSTNKSNMPRFVRVHQSAREQQVLQFMNLLWALGITVKSSSLLSLSLPLSLSRLLIYRYAFSLCTLCTLRQQEHQNNVQHCWLSTDRSQYRLMRWRLFYQINRIYGWGLKFQTIKFKNSWIRNFKIYERWNVGRPNLRVTKIGNEN